MDVNKNKLNSQRAVNHFSDQGFVKETGVPKEKEAANKPEASQDRAKLITEISAKPVQNQDEILGRLINKFIDHMIEKPLEYSMGHSSQEAFDFVLKHAQNSEKAVLIENFAKAGDNNIQRPNQKFINKLDQILETRMHDEQTKTGVFSSIFHNPDTKAYLNSQDRQTFWPSHIPDELDYT